MSESEGKGVDTNWEHAAHTTNLMSNIDECANMMGRGRSVHVPVMLG